MNSLRAPALITGDTADGSCMDACSAEVGRILLRIDGLIWQIVLALGTLLDNQSGWEYMHSASCSLQPQTMVGRTRSRHVGQALAGELHAHQHPDLFADRRGRLVFLHQVTENLLQAPRKRGAKASLRRAAAPASKNKRWKGLCLLLMHSDFRSSEEAPATPARTDCVGSPKDMSQCISPRHNFSEDIMSLRHSGAIKELRDGAFAEAAGHCGRNYQKLPISSQSAEPVQIELADAGIWRAYRPLDHEATMA